MNKLALSALALVLAFGAGFMAHGWIQDGTVGKLQTEADYHRSVANDAKAKEREYARKASDAESRGMDAGRQAEALKLRVDALRGASIPSGKPMHSGSGVAVGSEPTAIPCAPDLLAIYPELIEAQDTQIAALKDQVNAQKGQIASLEKALRETELRADIQAQATRAALAGMRQARWINRAEGFAVGAVISYGWIKR
jgi:hypothetical protein